LFRLTQLIFVFILPLNLLAQLGGKQSFAFLDIPVAARTSALGGSAVGYMDKDINLVYDNPANLDSSLHQNFSANYINFVSDINAGTFYYAHKVKNGALGVGVQFLGYGKFEKTEANGDVTGEFKAGDYALTVGYGRSFDSVWSVGANLKLIYSNYYQYSAAAVAADIGGGYKARNGLFTAGIVAKNIGASLSKNAGGEREKLPFEMNIGLSQRVPNAPFRFHLQYHHLECWDLGSLDPNYKGGTNIDPKTGEETRKKFTSNNLMRHFVIGTDLVFGKNFYLTIAYNFRRRQELAFDSRAGLAGFSGGVGLKIKRLRFNYSYSQYTLKGGSSHIGISTNFGEYFSKR
jgi:hypothetical protein